MIKTAERDAVEKMWSLQRRVFGDTWPRDLQQLLEAYHLQISVELAELIQETNFKRHQKLRQINMPALQEEAIDVLIYAFEICGAVFDADYNALLEMLLRKVNKNDARIDWDVNQLKRVV